MKNNRNTYKHRVRTKRQEVNGKFLPGAMLIPVLVVAASLCLGYLWICSRNEDIARQIKLLEAEKKNLDHRVNNEVFKWANATSPDKIQALLLKHDLKMELPRDKSIARIRLAAGGTAYARAGDGGTDLARGARESAHD